MNNKINVISYTNYPENKGGVPLYNYYLNKVFPEAKRFGWSDFPYTQNVKTGMREEEMAFLLNTYLNDAELIKEGDIVIGDGIWGNYGLCNQKFKLISVCHGPWSATIDKKENRAMLQKQGYIRSHTVSVSPIAAEECKKDYDIHSTALLTGLNTDFWSPSIEDTNKKNIIVWQAGKWNDIRKIREDCIKMLPEFEHVCITTYDDEEVRNSYRRAKIYAHFTSYEANSFAILKALSCDIPVIGTQVGLLACNDIMQKNKFAVSIKNNPSHAEKCKITCKAIKNIIQNYSDYYPREWILNNCTIELFEKHWKKFIEEVLSK